jgi:hypothetical protein
VLDEACDSALTRFRAVLPRVPTSSSLPHRIASHRIAIAVSSHPRLAYTTLDFAPFRMRMSQLWNLGRD